MRIFSSARRCPPGSGGPRPARPAGRPARARSSRARSTRIALSRFCSWDFSSCIETTRPGRLVGDPHGRVGGVHRLPAGARRAVDVDLEVVGVHLHVDLLGLRQHRHGGGGGVDAALRLGLGHALHPVRAALVLEHAVGALALHGERVVAVGHRQRLGLESAALGVAVEHPVEVAGEQPGLLPTGARAHLHDHVLLVAGIGLDHRQADLLVELGQARLRGGQHLAHLRVLAVLVEHLAGAGGIRGRVAATPRASSWAGSRAW